MVEIIWAAGAYSVIIIMVHELLMVQVSIVTSNSIFSIGWYLINDYRISLGPTIV